MPKGIELYLNIMAVFYIVYILLYTTYLFLSVLTGAIQLYTREKRARIRNELKHDYYTPVSVLVPAYNEEVTIVDTVESLICLDYRLYEVIVIDDGSTDETAQRLISRFQLEQTHYPLQLTVPCKPVKEIYTTMKDGVQITLIRKENGGKGDALNMGINASRYPYYVCLDADSVLQRDSLEKIVQPLFEDENIVAVGGMIMAAQSVQRKDGNIIGYHLPGNWLIDMQVVEYDRSFLASRILMDGFRGNLIISGAFGLFRKDVVKAVGGYATDTLGEDMELVMKLHEFCRSNKMPYAIRYEPNACCWSQVPVRFSDLMRQRRRWYLGMLQCMYRYARIFLNVKYGAVSFISYSYYLLFELLSPVVEMVGLFTTILAFAFGALNLRFMLEFLLLYSIYGATMTITAFFQRIYTRNLKISVMDVIRAVFMCFLENILFRYVLSIGRGAALLSYPFKKNTWGKIKRVTQSA